MRASVENAFASTVTKRVQTSWGPAATCRSVETARDKSPPPLAETFPRAQIPPFCSFAVFLNQKRIPPLVSASHHHYPPPASVTNVAIDTPLCSTRALAKSTPFRASVLSSVGLCTQRVCESRSFFEQVFGPCLPLQILCMTPPTTCLNHASRWHLRSRRKKFPKSHVRIYAVPNSPRTAFPLKSAKRGLFHLLVNPLASTDVPPKKLSDVVIAPLVHLEPCRCTDTAFLHEHCVLHPAIQVEVTTPTFTALLVSVAWGSSRPLRRSKVTARLRLHTSKFLRRSSPTSAARSARPTGKVGGFFRTLCRASCLIVSLPGPLEARAAEAPKRGIALRSEKPPPTLAATNPLLSKVSTSATLSLLRHHNCRAARPRPAPRKLKEALRCGSLATCSTRASTRVSPPPTSRQRDSTWVELSDFSLLYPPQVKVQKNAKLRNTRRGTVSYSRPRRTS